MTSAEIPAAARRSGPRRPAPYFRAAPPGVESGCNPGGNETGEGSADVYVSANDVGGERCNPGGNETGEGYAEVCVSANDVGGERCNPGGNETGEGYADVHVSANDVVGERCNPGGNETGEGSGGSHHGLPSADNPAEAMTFARRQEES